MKRVNLKCKLKGDKTTFLAIYLPKTIRWALNEWLPKIRKHKYYQTIMSPIPFIKIAVNVYQL